MNLSPRSRAFLAAWWAFRPTANGLIIITILIGALGWFTAWPTVLCVVIPPAAFAAGAAALAGIETWVATGETTDPAEGVTAQPAGRDVTLERAAEDEPTPISPAFAVDDDAEAGCYVDLRGGEEP